MDKLILFTVREIQPDQHSLDISAASVSSQ